MKKIVVMFQGRQEIVDEKIDKDHSGQEEIEQVAYFAAMRSFRMHGENPAFMRIII